MSHRLSSALDSSTPRQQSTSAGALSVDGQRPSPRHSSILPEPPRHLRWSTPMPAHDRQQGATEERASSNLSEEDLSRTQRLQRVLLELSRVQAVANAASSTVASYSNRTPSPNRQNLYDWAPSQHRQDRVTGGVEHITRDSGRNEEHDRSESSRSAQQRREREQHARGDALRMGTERELTSARDLRLLSLSEQISRARGAGQLPSDHGTGNASRLLASRIIADESRQLVDLRRRAHTLREFQRLGLASGSDQNRLVQAALQATENGLAREDTGRESATSAGRTARSTSATDTRSTSCLLEDTLLYLDNLRFCDEDEQAITAANSCGLVRQEILADRHDDFITDLFTIKTFAQTSWLQPGTIFKGHQHASTSSDPSHLDVHSAINGTSGHSSGRSARSSFNTLNRPSDPTEATPSVTSNAGVSHEPHQLHSGGGTPKDPRDQWPVRVIIHAVDYDKMLVQGTMEAYDVPQNNGPATLTPNLCTTADCESRPRAGKKSAPIKTYLEGHIIDLRTHSFLTPDSSTSLDAGDKPLPNLGRHKLIYSNANPATDAAYWRQLPPFSSIIRSCSATNDTLARVLLSKSRMQAIHENYIFMRWKERCFVHAHGEPCADPANAAGDQDRGHGLTISGFYYVSLRRSDGVVAGLYLDKGTTPFQRLHLEGSSAGWPAFELR